MYILFRYTCKYNWICMHYMCYFIVSNIYRITYLMYIRWITYTFTWYYLCSYMHYICIPPYNIYMCIYYIYAFTHIIYSLIRLSHIRMYYSMIIFDEQSNIYLYEVYYRWTQLKTDTLCCEPVQYRRHIAIYSRHIAI